MQSKHKMSIPKRNLSPYGWWVATLVERFEYDHEDKSNPRRRCQAWTNTIILKADNREHAFDKAIEYGKLGISEKSDYSDDKGRKGRWKFEGLCSLLPVYDEIDPDGTEIVYDENTNVTVGRVQSWIRTKEQLEAFDDSE